MTRALSGVVYIAIIVAALLLQGWALAILCTAFAAIASYEYVALNDKVAGGHTPTYLKVIDILLITLPVAIVTFLFTIDNINQSVSGNIATLLMAFTPFLILGRMVISVFDSSQSAISSLKTAVFGLFYISFPLFAVYFIDLIDPYIALMMFVLIWVNDTGAFCVGCTMGRHKLCERLSPKKTIEGFVGGLLFSVIAAALYAYFAGHHMISFVIFGIMVGIMATIGDLFESMLKRRAGVKDAGHLIPGHGGLLDRIDSLLFVAPVTLLFMFYLLMAFPTACLNY